METGRSDQGDAPFVAKVTLADGTKQAMNTALCPQPETWIFEGCGPKNTQPVNNSRKHPHRWTKARNIERFVANNHCPRICPFCDPRGWLIEVSRFGSAPVDRESDSVAFGQRLTGVKNVHIASLKPHKPKFPVRMKAERRVIR